MRPILGSALEIDSEEIVVVAKTLLGWSNLCRLCSPAHRDQPKGEARTTRATAARHRGDLFYLTATQDESRLRTLQEALGRDAVFLELCNHLRAGDPWLLEVQALARSPLPDPESPTTSATTTATAAVCMTC